MNENTAPSASVRALHVLVLGGLSAIGPLSTDMYLPALPALGHDLGATMSQAQVTLSAGILGLSLGQMIAGPMSDAVGRRRPLIIGIITFVLASLLCIVAPSVGALTALRFVQGTAGATGIVLSLAMARDLYAGAALARCLSLLMMVTGLAPIAAPVIGSLLLTFTSWRGVFVAIALIGVLLLLAAVLGLRETLPVGQRQRGGIAATIASFRDLLMDRRFLGYALTVGLAFAAGITYISASPFVLENIYGVPPRLVVFLFGINALGLAIMAQVSARLVGRVSSQALLSWGLTAIALGGTTLLIVVLGGIDLIGILPALFVVVASLGFIAPNATTLALATTRAAGSASALLGVLETSIGAVTAPIVGIGGTTSAVPMAAVIAAFGIGALITFLALCRPARVLARCGQSC